jgi:hypothetical protein
MSASEYWGPLENLLSEWGHLQAPRELVAQGWAPAENLDALTALMAEHDGVYCFEGDEDRCKCGKWIEWDHYEWEDHASAMLRDSGLLIPEPSSGASPVLPPSETPTIVPEAYEWPRRVISLDLGAGEQP